MPIAGVTPGKGAPCVTTQGIERVLISGSFSKLEKAVRIGLLPDIDRGKFRYLGNSSIAGAYMALLSETLRSEGTGICRAMTYIDFSTPPLHGRVHLGPVPAPHQPGDVSGRGALGEDRGGSGHDPTVRPPAHRNRCLQPLNEEGRE